MSLKKVLTVGAVLVAVIVVGVVLGRSSVKLPLAANPGPGFEGPLLSVNGLGTFNYSSGLNQASTSVCSFKSPDATSTLVFGTATLRTGTTTGLMLEWGKSVSPSATTTSLGVTSLGTLELATFRASSTPGDFGATASAGGKDPQFVFGPSQYLTLKYGGARGALNVLAGTCKVQWIVN